MSTTTVVTTKRKKRNRKSRKSRGAKAVEAGAKAVERRVANEVAAITQINRGVPAIAVSRSSDSAMSRRNYKRLEKLAITGTGGGPSTQINLTKNVSMTLYSQLTRDLAPYQHTMLRNYLKNLVDPYTNVFQLGVEGRIPDSNSAQSAVIKSKKIIPINVLWTPGDPNSGKFSLGCRPVLGSFDTFDNFQDFLIGEKGWPDGINTTFSSQSLYVNEFTSASNQSWPLAYDPNYNFLASSPAQSFTMFGTRTSAFSSVSGLPGNSTLLFGTPLGQKGLLDTEYILPIQKTPGLKVVVSNDGANANIVSVPPGMWYITATHAFTTAATPLQRLQPNVEPVLNSCNITELNYNWVVGNDLNPREGVANQPSALDNTWPNTAGYLSVMFYVQNTNPSQASTFEYYWTNTGGGSNNIDTTLFRGMRQGVEDGLFQSKITFTEDEYYIGRLSQTQTSHSLGLASKVRPSSMSVWFKPSIAPIAQGGSTTISLVPRGVFESNFLGDSANVSPGQLQEFSDLDQVRQNTCNFKVQDGAYAWWRVSDIADYKYREIIDTQAQLDADEEQYQTIVISGVVPPTPGTQLTDPLSVNVGYVEVVRVFEVLSAAQLLDTMSYVGEQEIIDVALALIDRGGLTQVHENPMHLKDIINWGKRIGLGVYNVGKRVNQFSKDLTGMDALSLASKSLALLAL